MGRTGPVTHPAVSTGLCPGRAACHTPLHGSLPPALTSRTPASVV